MISTIKQTLVKLTIPLIEGRDESPPNGAAVTSRRSGPTKAVVTWLALTVADVAFSLSSASVTGPGTVVE